MTSLLDEFLAQLEKLHKSDPVDEKPKCPRCHGLRILPYDVLASTVDGFVVEDIPCPTCTSK